MTDNEFNRISEQYIDIVYRSAINICKNKSDAEDAVQNTFLKLLKSDIDFENEDRSSPRFTWRGNRAAAS